MGFFILCRAFGSLASGFPDKANVKSNAALFHLAEGLEPLWGFSVRVAWRMEKQSSPEKTKCSV